MRKVLLLATLLMSSVLLLAACSDDEPEETADPTATATATEAATEEATEEPTEEATEEATEEPTAEATGEATAAAGESIEITGVDYAFEGVPETAEPGTTFTFTNGSDAEVHELVMFRLPEGEERPIEELLQLPEEEASELTGPPVGVAVAMPGEDGMVVEGDLTVEEPGRYVMLCFIPTGADPAALQEAMENPTGEAPEVEGGPPHFVQGMAAEFTVAAP